MKVNDFYRSLFCSLGLKVDDENGGIIVTDFTDSVPITVGGKKLYLPTKENLASPDFDTKVYFHPLSEDVLSGAESKVIKRLRKLINTRLNTVGIMLINELLGVAADTKLHKELNPDQQSLIHKLVAANPKAVRDFDKVAKALIGNNKDILDIFVKPNGVYRNVKCSRTAIVKFFFEGEKDNNELTFMGTPIGTQRDKKTIVDLFHYVFNNQGDSEYYNFGSNDPTAPFFHALLGGFMKVGGRINELIRLYDNLLSADFKEALGKQFKPMFDWDIAMSSFAVMANEIPPLPDNTGSDETSVMKVKTSTFAKPETTTINPAEQGRKTVSLQDALSQRESTYKQEQSSFKGGSSFNDNNRFDNNNRFGNDWRDNNDRSFGNQRFGSFSDQYTSGFGGGFGQRRQASINDINVSSFQVNSWGRN